MTEKQKNPVGRPTVMTPEVLEKLEVAFSYGSTDKEACFLANISEGTLYEYQKVNPEFIERKEALKQRPFLEARQAVINAFKDNPELALKYLERKKKDEFSLRQEVTGKDGEAVAITGINYIKPNGDNLETNPEARPSIPGTVESTD